MIFSKFEFQVRSHTFVCSLLLYRASCLHLASWKTTKKIHHMVFSRFQRRLRSQTFVCVLPPSFATRSHLKAWKTAKVYIHDFRSFQYFAKCLVFASSLRQPRGKALSYKAFWPTLKMAVQSVVFFTVSPVWLPLASPYTENQHRSRHGYYKT